MLPQPTIRKVLISFFLGVLASIWGLVVPAYNGTTAGEIPVNRESSSQAEMPVHPGQRRTLAEVNGPAAYVWLAIPVMIAGMPIVFRSRAVRTLAAVLLMGWVAIGVASKGLFYIPSSMFMVWSALGKSA